MKTYTIGELIHNFKSTKYIGYAISGKLKGSLIFANTDNKNILTTILPSGEVYEQFTICLSDISKEEGKQWVFAHEVDSKEVLEELHKSYHDILKNVLKDLV